MNDSLNPEIDNQLSPWRIYLFVAGSVVMFFAALSTGLIPIYITILFLSVGWVLQLSARLKSPPMNWRSRLIYLAGSALLLAIVWSFGEKRVIHWTPRPAGLVVAWVVCFYGFRQLRYIKSHFANHSTDAA